MGGLAGTLTGIEPVMKNVACNLCGSAMSRPLHTIPDFWMEQNDIEAIFVRCDDCGLVYQNPQPCQDEIRRSYPQRYRAVQQAHTFFHRYGLIKRARLITRYKRPGFLLDVGCGDGSFMHFMQQDLNWKTIGTETESPGPLPEAILQPSLDIRYGRLEQLAFPENSFDAVTLWDVLEHLQNPRDTLKEARRILKREGILVLRLPNLDSWDARLFRQYWAGYDAPRHLFVFSQKTLVRMLEQTGFSIVESRSDIGNYLNFVKSVQFWLTGHKSNPAGRKIMIAVLRSLPARLLAYPINLMKDSNMRGSEMVIVAVNGQPE
jgi:ubiquinone/menaquinone biosynthesis C-methylase UbiE